MVFNLHSLPLVLSLDTAERSLPLQVFLPIAKILVSIFQSQLSVFPHGRGASDP